EKHIRKGDALGYLLRNYHMEERTARSIISYVKEQMAAGAVPTMKRILVEGYVDGSGRIGIIFHMPFGRRTNEALARGYSTAISRKYRMNVRMCLTDDGFMLTVPKAIPLDEIPGLLRADDLEDAVKESVVSSEVFKQRFRHCAMRSFMVLRNYQGKDIPVSKQVKHSETILQSFYDPEFPVIKETFNEVLNEYMDIGHAREVLKKIEKGRMKFVFRDYSDVPTPFSYNIVLAGASDIIMMEDKTTLLKELHSKMIERLISSMPETDIKPSLIEEFYRSRTPRVESREDIVYLLECMGAMHVLEDRPRSIYRYTDLEFSQVKKWAESLIREGRISSVWIGEALWAPAEDVPMYRAVYGQNLEKEERERLLKRFRSKPTMEVLKKLEKAYLVERVIDEDGRITYRRRSVRAGDYGRSLVTFIRRFLRHRAPASVEEIAYHLNVDEEVVSKMLMEMTSDVAAIKFDGRIRYLLVEDKMSLEHQEKRAFHERTVTAYLLKKHFKERRDILEYFRDFIEANLPYDIFVRVKNFTPERWWTLREKGEVLEGRLINGRVGYTTQEIAEHIRSAMERAPLNETEKKVLDYIGKHPGVSFLSLIKVFDEIPRSQIREIVDRMDRDMYVFRALGDKKEWSAKNRYVRGVLREVPREEAVRYLVTRVVESYGPLPVNLIRYHTGLPYDEIHHTLSAMEARGVITRINVVGRTPQEMYVSVKELPHLEELKDIDAVEDRLRILSYNDPYSRRLWPELTRKYGEGWYYPVIKNGRPVGTVEMWGMSGCLEVRDFRLDSDDLIPELLAALDEALEYHRTFGTEVLRIKNMSGKSVSDAPKRSLKRFEKHGYVHLGDMLAKGSFSVKRFEPEDIMAYLLYRQHLTRDSRFSDTLSAIKFMW
ncbi:MAG: hypothetical protein DRG33_08010, partial [Deltaproteobacteria bacterium]